MQFGYKSLELLNHAPSVIEMAFHLYQPQGKRQLQPWKECMGGQLQYLVLRLHILYLGWLVQTSKFFYRTEMGLL